MLIPLETKGKRVVVTITVKPERPMVLGIIVQDPLRPRTHYLRRKAPLRLNEEREIHLPLPVSPGKAVLELYDKDYAPDKIFKLKDIEINPMPERAIWAVPERHRFMNFAIDFAQKAGYVDPGFYSSKDYEFLIHYLPIITNDDGKELITPARIHRNMPRVQLSKRLFDQFSIPVRIAILAHEGCHYFNNTRSEKEADLCGIKYYLDAGFPSIEAMYAATEVFLKHPETVNQVHTTRARDIRSFIDSYKVDKTLAKI